MYYYIASYINSAISIHRESDEEEYKAVCELQSPLQEVDKHKRRFDSVRRAYDRITKIGDSLMGHSDDYDIEDFGNAISDYMFSFRKFLDTWETYIKRTFGEDCFVGYYQGDYLPVSLVSFASSLDYLLSEKDALLNYSEKEAMAVIKVAITKNIECIFIVNCAFMKGNLITTIDHP